MKTKLIFMLILLSTSFISAQVIKSIGIKSGMALSNQKWQYSQFDQLFKVENHTGFYGVITADFITKPHWELSVDLGYYQNFGRVVNEITPYKLTEIGEEFDMKYGFITLSPIVKFKTSFHSFTPYLCFGPRMDNFISGLSNDGANFFKTEVSKTLWGINYGIGISYSLHTISIIVEYQYFYSFNYMINQAAKISSDTFIYDKVKFNSQILSLGIKYHFKKGV